MIIRHRYVKNVKNSCKATTMAFDDRFGGFLMHCELSEGHQEEDHQHLMSACKPVAYLHWHGTYKEYKNDPK